jgi:hypothetical protein
VNLYYESNVSVAKRVVPDPLHAWGFDAKMVIDSLERYKNTNGHYPRQRWTWAAAHLGNSNFKNYHSVKKGENKKYSGPEAVRRLVLQYKPSYCSWGSISVPNNSKATWGFDINDIISTVERFKTIQTKVTLKSLAISCGNERIRNRPNCGAYVKALLRQNEEQSDVLAIMNMLKLNKFRARKKKKISHDYVPPPARVLHKELKKKCNMDPEMA